MSYTKQDLREAFYAGKLGGITFDSWVLKNKNFNQMVSLYQQSFIKFIDVPSSYGLNVRTSECVRLKHILRGVLMREVPNITLYFLSDVEVAAGSKNRTDHTTILNSLSKYDEMFQNHYITGQIKKIIEKEDI